MRSWARRSRRSAAGPALGIFFAVNGLAVAGGPLVGGAVTQGIAWEWIFWLNVPIGLVLIPLALARIPESRGPDSGVDLAGLALVSGGVLGVVWALVRGNTAGWGSTEVLGALVAGLGLMAAFIGVELRTRAPMLPMRFFRSRAFSAGNAAIFCAVGSLFGAVFFMSQFLQRGSATGPWTPACGCCPGRQPCSSWPRWPESWWTASASAPSS